MLLETTVCRACLYVSESLRYVPLLFLLSSSCTVSISLSLVLGCRDSRLQVHGHTYVHRYICLFVVSISLSVFIFLSVSQSIWLLGTGWASLLLSSILEDDRLELLFFSLGYRWWSSSVSVYLNDWVCVCLLAVCVQIRSNSSGYSRRPSTANYAKLHAEIPCSLSTSESHTSCL